jgi:hypothetical protein
MKRVLQLAISALCAVCAQVPATASADVTTWQFDVLLDGRRIGEHEFRLAERGELKELTTRARFRVSALFVPLYRYEHENREIWRDGCVARMDARTRQNGDESDVQGVRDGAVFEVRGPDGTERLPGCVKTFAYWDPAILREQRLLNAQTGIYERVDVTSIGTETLEVAGRRVVADRHVLRAGGYKIDLWYSPDGEWLALESLTPQGRKLRYVAR